MIRRTRGAWRPTPIAGRLTPTEDGTWQWDRLDPRFGPDQGAVYHSLAAAEAMSEQEMQIRTPWGMGEAGR